jgi:hypothetical protein
VANRKQFLFCDFPEQRKSDAYDAYRATNMEPDEFAGGGGGGLIGFSGR